MTKDREKVDQAASLYRSAAAIAAVAGYVLGEGQPSTAAADKYHDQRGLTANLRAAAAKCAPGWLGAPLDALAAATPLGGAETPMFVRIGQAHPLDDAQFPAVVPLLRAGHIAIDGDARDPRVAGLMRAMLLRLLAAAVPGSIQLRVVDAASAGSTLRAFEDLVPEPVTNEYALRGLLAEAEQWVARHRAPAASRAASAPADGQTMLLVMASLPELTDGRDLARIVALANDGPTGGLHIIAGGWPPPPVTAETTQRPLPHCTQITLRNPHVWVGDPPSATFAAGGRGPGRLSAPVYLDGDPPVELINRVRQELPATVAGIPQDPAVATAAWTEYLTAAQRLDASRRQAAAVVVEQTATLKIASIELVGVRAKLGSCYGRLVAAWTAAGGPPPALTPTGAELAAAGATLPRGASRQTIVEALRRALATLDAAEAVVAPPPEPPRSQVRRNLAVYTLFAVLAAFGQLPLLLMAGSRSASVPVALAFAALLPVAGFAMAWLVVWLSGGRDARARSSLAGTVICAASAAPVVFSGIVAAISALLG